MDFVKSAFHSAKDKLRRNADTDSKAAKAQAAREAQSLDLLGDGAEGQQMKMLWESYEEVLSEENGAEKAQPLLVRFQQAFMEQYEFWYPELSVGLGHGAYTAVPRDDLKKIVSLPRAMPPRVVERVSKLFASEWQITARYLLAVSGADGRAGSPPVPSPSRTRQSKEKEGEEVLLPPVPVEAKLLHTIAILTRSSRNRKLVREHAGLSATFRLGRTAVRSLVSVCKSLAACQGNPDPKLVASTQAVVDIVMLLVRILASYLDSQQHWLQAKNDAEEVRIRPSMSPTASTAPPPDSPSGHSGGGSPASSELGDSLETDCFCLIADVLRAQQVCAWTFPLLPCQYELQYAALDCVGAALIKVSQAQSKLRKAGLVDIIANMIGWPQALTRLAMGDSGIEYSEDLSTAQLSTIAVTDNFLSPAALSEDDRAIVHHEYQTQLLCLHILRDLIHQNRESSRRFHELSGFHKLCDLTLWMSTYFRHSCTDSQGGTPELTPDAGEGEDKQDGSKPVKLTKCLSETASKPAEPDYFARKASIVQLPAGRRAVSSTSEASSSGRPDRGSVTSPSGSPGSHAPSPLATSTSSPSASGSGKFRQLMPQCVWPEVGNGDVDLNALYNVLFSLCLSGPGHLQGGGPSAADISPVHREVLYALCALLDTDCRPSPGNALARRYWRSHSCELQLRVLDLFATLVGAETSALPLLRDSTLFAQLLSDDYLMRKFDIMASSVPSEVWACYSVPNTFQSCSGTSAGNDCVSWLCRDTPDGNAVKITGLRHYIMAFLSYTACVPGMSNAAECKLFLNLMEQYSSCDEVLCVCTNALASILQHARSQTQTALLDLDALGVFAGLIGADGRTEEVDGETGETKARTLSRDIPVYAPVSPIARNTVLNMMSIFFESKIVVHIAMGDIRLINQLFPLLFDDQTKDLVFDLIKRLMQEGIPASDSSQALSQQMLFTTYMEMFMALKSEPKERQSILTLDLLHGIRDIISTVQDRSLTAEKQRQFNEAGCFIWIMTLLNVEEEEGLFDLCVAVLQTLTALMSGHEENKDFFAKNIGYDQLKNLILRAEQGQPTESLFDLLFDMIVGDHFDMEKNNTFRNPHAMALLFELLPHAALELRVTLFDKLTTLLRKCTRNLAVCCSVNLLSASLAMIDVNADEELLRRQVEFASVLGTHSITVSELKQFFSLLKSTRGDFRPNHTRLFLTALKEMTKKHGCNVFFDLDGRRSGLKLPVLDKWPGYRGYSFSAWLRVEAFSDPLGRLKYEPRLYSFLTASGDGLEAFFSGTSLCLQTSRRGKTYSAVLDYRFSPLRWYHVAIVHAVKKTAFSQSWLRLYVNGELQKTVALKYPHNSEPLIHNRIGTNSAVTFNLAHTDSPDHRNAMPVQQNPLFGQLGAVYFFEDALTPQQVQWVYDLGWDYMYMFQQTDAGSTMGGNPAAFDGILTAKVFASYNAKVSEGTLFLDNTPETNERPFGLHARCMPGTMACVTRNVSSLIHCLGGINVLLPLLPQLDQPIAPRLEDGAEPSDISKIDYTVDPTLGALVISLLAEMLRRSPSNCAELVAGNTLQVTSMQLRQISPQHMGAEMLHSFTELIEVLDKYPALQKDVYTQLIYDYSLWVYTPYIVHEHLSRVFRANIKTDITYFREHFGVQWILDTVRTYLWTSPEPDSQCEKPVLHAVTQEVLGQRPSEQELMIVRRNLLDLLERLVADGNGITPDEMTALVQFVQDCRDAPVLTQVLQTFFDLLFRQAAQMVEIVANQGGLDMFVSLLNRPHEGVRVLSLRIIAKLLSSSASFLAARKTRIRLDDPHSQVPITRALECYPLTMTTYHAIFAVLRCYVTDDARDVIHPSRDTYSLRNPTIIATILQVALTAPTSLRITVLRDLHHQLVVSQENRQKFLSQSGWQHWLLDFIANNTLDEDEVDDGADTSAIQPADPADTSAPTSPQSSPAKPKPSPNTAASGDESPTERVHDLVLSVCTIVLFHSLQEVKGGWEAVEFTLGVISTYSARGVVNAPDLVCDLLLRLIAKLKADATGIPNDKTGPATANIVQFALLIENVLFYPEANSPPAPGTTDIAAEGFTSGDLSMGPRLGKNEDGEEVWLDAELADKLVEVLAHWQLTRMLDFAQLNVPLNSRTHVRPGGFLRIALRLVLHALQRKNIDLSAPAFYCQFIMTAKPFKDGSPQVLYILSFLFRALNETTDGDVSQSTLGKLTKHVLRTHRPYLATILLDNHLKSLLATEPDWLPENAPVGDFIKETRSEVWATAIKEHIFGAANRVTEEELSYEPAITARRETIASRVHQQQATIAEAELEEEKTRQQERQAIIQKQTYAEVNRRSALAAERDHEYRQTRRAWRGLLRSLTNERGLWGTTTDTGPVYWKLDKTENYRRERRKMKREYNVDPHHGKMLLKQAAADDASDGEGGEGRDDPRSPTQHAPDTPQPPALISGIKLADGSEDPVEDTDAKSEADWDFAKVDGEDAAVGGSMQPEEKTLYSCVAELVNVKSVTLGKFELTTTHIYFSAQYSSEESTLDFPPEMRTSNQDQDKLLKDRKWPLSSLRELHLRRYLLRRSGMEMFMTDHTNYFFHFKKADRTKVYNKIVRLRPANLVAYRSPGSSDILKNSSITTKWQRGEISNFDYLMLLNTLAGRTYNDLTQYPVFPWILQDYTSETIDLDDPGVYRDLSKPVGALDARRLETLVERYECFDDPEVPKFHYGTHYSSAGIVLYYCIRLEPFTRLALQLQSGKFDHADRLFDSIPSTWANVLHNSGDVKELIPEFFYLPEIFQNVNRLDLGTKQGGTPLDNVGLPPWASSAEEFIKINRQALESPHVSAHLHEWIDLIFGFKQRGQAAVDACNVFYHLTYEGAVDIDKIEDPNIRKATVSQIANFGQTPSQLFEKPHPRRTLITPPESPFKQPQKIKAFFLQHATGIVDESLAYVQIQNDKVITLGADRDIGIHRFAPQTPHDGLPFTFELDRSLYSEWDRQEHIEKKTSARGIRPERAQLLSGSRSLRRIPAPFDPAASLSTSSFHISRDGKFLFTSGHWDMSWKIVQIDSARVIQSVCQHKDIVTSLSVSKDGKTVVTGSKDTTVMVWSIDRNDKQSPVHPRPLHILNGHDGEVTCVAVNTEFDMVLSAGKDGACLMHTLRTGRLVRELHPGATLSSRPLCINPDCVHPSLSYVTISPSGRLLTYSMEDLFLRLYSINGTELASVDTYERLHAFKITRDGDYLITGGEKREVTLRSMFDLSVVYRWAQPSEKPERAISCLDIRTTPKGDMSMLVGSEDGKLLFFAVHREDD